MRECDCRSLVRQPEGHSAIKHDICVHSQSIDPPCNFHIPIVYQLDMLLAHTCTVYDIARMCSSQLIRAEEIFDVNRVYIVISR